MVKTWKPVIMSLKMKQDLLKSVAFDFLFIGFLKKFLFIVFDICFYLTSYHIYMLKLKIYKWKKFVCLCHCCECVEGWNGHPH